MASRLDGHTHPPLLVDGMTADPIHGNWQLADGSRFRWGPNTVLVELAGVDVGVAAHTLHINHTAAMLTPPRGTTGRPWRVSLDTALEIVERVNVARAAAGVPPVVLPRRFIRNARHVGAMRGSPTGGLPFPVVDADGFPGLVDRNQTLWVHRATGATWLEVATLPERLTPTEAATAKPAKTFSRLGVRAAHAWFDAQRYPFRPAELSRRREVDDEPQPGVGPGGA